MNKNILNVGIYAPFDLDSFNSNIDDASKKSLKTIYSSINYLDTEIVNDKSKYDILILEPNLSKKKISDDIELIYRIDKINDLYRISTGRYIGELNINGVCLNITSGYSKSFEQRLLNYSNDIYINKDIRDLNNDTNRFRYIIEYLYLSSLRKSLTIGLPKYYMKASRNDFNIKGNIDINKYIKNIKNNYKGIPYDYNKQVIDKTILTTIYKAYSLCNTNLINNEFKDIRRFFYSFNPNELLKEFRIDYINKAKDSIALSNSIYTSYKKVLRYAESIIKNNISSNTNTKDNRLVSGWLLDISELFELYLYKLIKNNFKDYEILYQEEIPIYQSLFINRVFIPDIIMKKDNKVIILDSKFKKMKYNRIDVDRTDLQQIHTYYSYYKSLGYDVKFTSLIYPIKEEKDIKLSSTIFDSSITNDLFGISYILVGNTIEEQIINEEKFIEKLRSSIEE